MPLLPTSAWLFSGGSESAVSPVISSADSTNCYPETEPPDAHTPVALVGTPGMTSIVTVNSPIRAEWSSNGRMFVVGGTHVYEINPVSGAVILDYGSMGGPGLAPCRFASNGTQLLVCNPDVGVQTIFNVNPVGPALDVVLGNAFDLCYLDTFFFAAVTTPTNGIRASASLDGGTWPTLSVVQRTGVPDQVTGLMPVNGQLWILGQQNIEVWANAGATPFPFQKISYGTIDAGTLSVFNSWIVCRAISVAGNTVLWLGADENGFAVVYQASGLEPIRVSTPAIESYFASIGNLVNASSFCYQEAGHLFFVLNFPQANSTLGATVVYDLTTRMWHKRGFLNGSTLERWRADCFCSVGSGAAARNFVGDYATGKIYRMDLSIASDDGSSIQRTRIAPIISNQNAWLSHGSFRLDGFFGSAVPTLGWSDGATNSDGSLIFNKSQFNMQQIGTVAAAGISTYAAHQLGRSRTRAYKVQITSSTQLVRLSNAYVDVNQ